VRMSQWNKRLLTYLLTSTQRNLIKDEYSSSLVFQSVDCRSISTLKWLSADGMRVRMRTDCPRGWFGRSCHLTCDSCHNDAVCDVTHTRCVCQPGWTDETCSTPCPQVTPGSCYVQLTLFTVEDRTTTKLKCSSKLDGLQCTRRYTAI